jgi:hydroxypyruvate isomerase
LTAGWTLASGIPAAAQMIPSAIEFQSEQKYRHSVCQWCYPKYPLEELCDIAKDCGIHSIELLRPDEWDIVLQSGLEVAVGYGSTLGIVKGFNNPAFHPILQAEYSANLPKAAEIGIPQLIVFSGNRNGITDEHGLEQCAIGLEPLVKQAEQYGVQLIMELLNSKIDHHDYQCDRTTWGVALVEKIGSPNFKLLYDIYHMQVMEGNIIHTITANKEYIGHFHTAGVPGRHEIDSTQELNYSAIMQAIANTGFAGYVAQEFIPKSDDPVHSLRESIRICSV